MWKGIEIFRLVAMFTCLLSGATIQSRRNAIDQILGAKGVYTPTEDVYKVTFPRNDIKVAVERWQIPSFLGLSSWTSFAGEYQREAMLMGDLALFEDEVNPVLSTALDNGLQVTALHNHFLFDNPKVMFMHIMGEGRTDDLARAVRKCLDTTKTIRAASPMPVSQFPGGDIPAISKIDASPLDRILGMKGQTESGMYKAVFRRSARMHGRELTGEMGLNTWAAFAGTDGNAVVDGDFAMLVPELQNVLKALRAAGINIVAIHNHMAKEEPQYVFLHYWGRGDAAKLAKGIRGALDRQSGSWGSYLSHPEH